MSVELLHGHLVIFSIAFSAVFDVATNSLPYSLFRYMIMCFSFAYRKFE